MLDGDVLGLIVQAHVGGGGDAKGKKNGHAGISTTHDRLRKYHDVTRGEVMWVVKQCELCVDKLPVRRGGGRSRNEGGDGQRGRAKKRFGQNEEEDVSVYPGINHLLGIVTDCAS